MMLSDPAAPFPIEGVRLPTWIIKFNKKGICESPKTQEALLAKIREAPKPTHVIFMSHGWNSDFADAIGQYQAFLKTFEQVVDDHRPAGDYRPLFVGVTWPSVWFPLDRGPRLAGPGAETSARKEVIRAVSEDLGEPAAEKRLSELVNKERLSMDEAREAATIVLPWMAKTDAKDIPEPDEPLTTAHIVAAAVHIQVAAEPPQPLGKPGTFNPAGPAQPNLAGLEWLDPRNLLRLFSLYQMKDRAGRVGSTGVTDLLRELLKTKIPIHVVGHSFGAKVMLSALCSKAPLAYPAASALLLQPAISYLSFAQTVPGRTGRGGYVAALEKTRVAKPIFSTYSRADFPLHDVFHAALRRAADLGDARIAVEAGPPPSRYAALGGYGPSGAGEILMNPIRRPGMAYSVDEGVRIVGLDGSASVDFPTPSIEARIACHGCVANPYTAWALHQQMF
jgi:hypothetical protein